ncbi:MAG: hypothetical protein R3B13_18375 [Polyangiaceae bacterium]
MVARLHGSIALLTASALAAAFGCQGEVIDPGHPGNGNGSGTTSTQVAGDLPCDVATVLSESCTPCHSDPPLSKVPMALISYADLTAPSTTHPGMTVAEVSLARMQDAKDPMPPTGVLPAADIAAFQSWIAAGMPPGDCGPNGSGSVPQLPLVCSSDTHWTGGNHESPLMRPGGTCIQCHSASGEGPTLLVAGTVYPTAREPDDCNGISAIDVVVTDAQGKTVTLSTNAAGNFFYEAAPGALVPPYNAKVVSGGKERVMKQSVASGDCNTCHTQDGKDGAPGRIYAP